MPVAYTHLDVDKRQLQSLMARYRNLGGGEEDEFLLRFHVSDPVRQSAPVSYTQLFSLLPAFSKNRE